MNRFSKRAFIVILVCLPVIGADDGPRTHGRPQKSELATLEKVRELVARNEALINPIKMKYTVKIKRTGERQVRSLGGRKPGRPFSYSNVVWAQSGKKQYVKVDTFYDSNELANSRVKIFDDQLKTEGKLPDLMEGYISPIGKHDWYHVLTTKLGIRPFEGKYSLSEILVSEHAAVHKELEIVENRQVYVVDAQRPDLYPYFVRIWIDKERGIPLRVCTYGQYPKLDPENFISGVNGIKLYQLPNGGWIPIEGVRALYFRRSDPPRVTFEYLSAEVNSITIQREDITESLFRIKFPDGARIYNVISGLTSVVGQPLKTYGQVVKVGGKFIAGTVTDPSGIPVPEVIVGVFAVKTRRKDGQFSGRLVSVHDRPCAVTDTKGRFAIELKQEGSYDLWFFPKEFADIRIRDIPLGEHDLKVTLRKGGTVTGRVVRMVDGRKEPVANIEVKAERGNKTSLASLRFGRMRTKTGSKGRFQIKYLSTRLPKPRSGDRQEQQYVPRLWRIRCGALSKTVLFEDGISTQEVELVLKPDIRAAPSLVGRTLPMFKGLGIDVRPEDIKDQRILICFFDMEQRPSRNCLRQLSTKAQELKAKDIVVVAVQASKVDENTLNQWVKKYNIPFTVGMIQGNEEKNRFTWGVKSMPWLILTDKKHIVRAEDFALAELNAKIKEANEGK